MDPEILPYAKYSSYSSFLKKTKEHEKKTGTKKMREAKLDRTEKKLNFKLFVILNSPEVLKIKTGAKKRHRVKYGLEYFLDQFFRTILKGEHTISTEGGVG